MAWLGSAAPGIASSIDFRIILILAPSEAEAILAKQTSRVLASHMEAGEPLQFRIGPAPEEAVQVPASAVRMLVRILEEMAKGNAG